MVTNFRLAISVLVVSSALAVSAAAQDLSALGNRTFLCVKRVGRSADGSNNRGRDAFMNPAPCPKGYFSINLLGLVGSKSTTGPQGEQGPQGPQGIPGPGGGVVFGRLINCEKPSMEENQSQEETPQVSTPCDPEESEYKRGHEGSYEVYIPGNSFLSRPDKACMFRLTNVPAGTYDLVLGKSGKGRFVRSIKGVVVSDGTSVSVGDVPVCQDLDDDGYDVTTDCDDSNADVNSDASEVCGDQIDNNCSGEIDEGCVSSPSSSSSSSSSSEPNPS